MKTVFIVIGRSFIIRNVLRSGILTALKKAGCRVVVFIVARPGSELPSYLKEEFEDEQVILKAIVSPPAPKTFAERLKMFIGKKTSLLVFTNSTWAYIKAGNLNSLKRGFVWKYVERFIFTVLGKLHFLKILVRRLEQVNDHNNIYASFFDDYKPDVVFGTSIIGTVDIMFMREAKSRKIKTVAMTKGWDHASRVLYKFIPDKIIIQNYIMKDYLIKDQRINPEVISVCGFPQFDWYTDKSLLLSREEYISSLGLNPNKKLIFFGSEGTWAPHDDKVAEMLSNFMNTPGSLIAESNMLIRPHFSDLNTKRFDKYEQVGKVVIDTNINQVDEFFVGWEPTMKEVKHFVNLMYHCDVLVNIASTLTLDAACLNKPIISIGFGVLFDARGRDVTNVYYGMDHYRDVLETGAVDYVKSEEELLQSVNTYLSNPTHKQQERKVLVDKLCYRVDGQSAQRVANEILAII